MSALDEKHRAIADHINELVDQHGDGCRVHIHEDAFGEMLSEFAAFVEQTLAGNDALAKKAKE